MIRTTDGTGIDGVNGAENDLAGRRSDSGASRIRSIIEKHSINRTRIAAGAAIALALAAGCVPGAALAYASSASATAPETSGGLVSEITSTVSAAAEPVLSGSGAASDTSAAHSGGVVSTVAVSTAAATAAAMAPATDKLLAYNPADIAAIGTQASTGHTICCPSFSCAYADAVMDGTVHDHRYYTCSCCTWPDWGGGNSSYRCVGTSEQLLREAYDQITAGKPTVIHVRANYGEHWIALIGYQNAVDPDHLTLANFTALDPWDGAQINPADRFALYGDGCEHISSR